MRGPHRDAIAVLSFPSKALQPTKLSVQSYPAKGTQRYMEGDLIASRKVTLVRANIFALFTSLFAGPPLTICY